MTNRIVDQIRRLLRKKQSRADRMTWSQDDLEKMNDRSKHLAWHPGDLKLIKRKKKLVEDLAHPENELGPKLGHTFKDSVKQDEPFGVNPPSVSVTKQYRDHVRKLGPLHMDAVKRYKGSSEAINHHLRQDKPFPEHKLSIAGNVNTLHKHLKKVTSFKTPQDHIVYRGFGTNMHEAARNMKRGDVFHDKGYTGTSFNHAVARDFAKQGYDSEGKHKFVARIHVPKGSKAHYLDAVPNPEEEEHELLLHHGTKFEVLGHSHYSLGPSRVHIVHMRVKEQE